MKFVTLSCGGPLGRHHDASVVKEDVELGFLGEEFFGRCIDGGEVVEI